VTKDQTKLKEEPLEGFVREDRHQDNTGADTPEPETLTDEFLNGAAAEVIEGEIIAQAAEEPGEKPAATEEEEEIDELTALRQQLEAAQTQADEYLDDLRRERAAFQNYKKRQENERVELRQMAQVNLLTQILPILDDMERALKTVPDEKFDQPWIEGLLLIQRKLKTTLESNGVVPIETEPGQPFDPFIHEAVTYEEHNNHQEGQVIAVVNKGYKLGERVLRPAMVRVAK
jgi:molecular chaperone GrpE